MRHAKGRLIALSALGLAALAPLQGGADEPPRYWAVTGVDAGDVLHLRDVPSADSKSLADIPPDAHGLRHLGCRRNHPSMDLWVRMSKAQRREALTQWCRVEFHGQEGWVAGRFLKPDSGSAH